MIATGKQLDKLMDISISESNISLEQTAQNLRETELVQLIK